jgi:hypothetical protein
MDHRKDFLCVLTETEISDGPPGAHPDEAQWLRLKIGAFEAAKNRAIFIGILAEFIDTYELRETRNRVKRVRNRFSIK